MTNNNDEIVLEDLVGNFYEPVGADHRSVYRRGQVFWSHISYSDEDLKIWRPTGLDESLTTVNSFKIENAPGDAFKRGIPLFIPPLETHEELLVVKAKRRPVIMLSPAPNRPAIQAMRQGGKIYRPMCVVGPVFSLLDRSTGRLKYPNEFIERIRKMEFPEFFFLPQGGPIRCPSYIRLAEVHAVNQPHLEPENFKLQPEVLSILLGQVRFLLTGEYEGNYQIYREQILNPSK
jgi:hypothetical protein